MAKRFRGFALVLAVVMLVCASFTAGVAETKMETVRVWTNDNGIELVLREKVDEFNATVGKELGIQVELSFFGGDYHDVLKVALAGEQGPEIYKFVGTVKDSFVDAGWMVALEDIPGSEALLTEWGDIIVEGYNTLRGKTYSLPVKVLNTKFIYNKTLLAENGFDAPPETWAELAEMARVVTENGNGEKYGFGIHLKNTGSSGKWYLATQFASGVGHMGFDFSKGEYRFVDFAPIIELYQQMRRDGSLFPGFEALSDEGLYAHFSAGRVALMAGVCWDVAHLNNTFPVADEWGVFQTPVLDVNNPYKSYAQAGDLLCIGAAGLDMPEKTLKVYELLHSDDVLAAIHEKGLEFIAKPSVQTAVTNPPTLIGWAEFADTSKSYFTMTPPDGLLTLEGETYQNVLANMISTDLTPEQIMEILTDMDARYNAALEKAVADGADMSSFINPEWDTRLK